MFTHQLFEAQAKETPDNIAVVFEEQSISYRELDCRANQLARRLRSLGVIPEVPVGICMERSVELVIAVLALLKAGGVYVPLDPSNPKERLSFIVNETRPKVLLAQERLLECLPEIDAKSICLDTDWSTVSAETADPVENLTHSENLGFLIYTSGSTGEPKAVMLPHRPRDPRTSHEQKLYQMTANDRHILKSSISFTLILRELFWPLLTGARLIISPPGTESDMDYLLQLIEKHQISMITLTPSTLRALLTQNGLERGDSLRHIVCFGEPFTAEAAQHAKGIEHRLGDAVGGEFAVAGEERFAGKGESPRDCALDAHARALGKFHRAGGGFNDACAIKRAFAIGVRRVSRGGTGSAALGVRFPEDDRNAVELGELADDG
jgi:non-ribosomal peptide synthetase component F